MNQNARSKMVLESAKDCKADPRWAPFTALKYKELGLHISAREVG